MLSRWQFQHASEASIRSLGPLSCPKLCRSPSYGQFNTFPVKSPLSKNLGSWHARTTTKPTTVLASKLDNSSQASVQGPVVVWFKNDLRVSDHPGLLEAARTGLDIIPVYCLDPKLVKDYLDIPGGVELLWGALTNLKKDLQALGADLCVRLGSMEDCMKKIVDTYSPSKIIAEVEVDYKYVDIMDRFEGWGTVEVSQWKASLWNEADYQDNFRDFSRVRGQPELICDPVEHLKFTSSKIDPGAIPEILEIRALLEAAKESFADGVAVDPFGKSLDSQEWVQWANMLTETPESVLQCLREYLSLKNVAGEGVNAILQQLVESVEESSMPGLSFSALFFPVLKLGVLSPRQVRNEAMESGSGPSLWGVLGIDRFSFASKAAITEVESLDFHCSLNSSERNTSRAMGVVQSKCWNWQGLAVEFTEAKPAGAGEDAPVVLLIHGFGASSFHWRRNVEELRDAGNHVYCLTLPGFGRTQKPSLKYSQYVWGQCIRDFIIGVVGKPVILAGNSIGGYSAAFVAAFHKSLVRGVVLLNSAGPITPGFTPEEAKDGETKSPPPKFAVDLFGSVLLTYLEKTAEKTLKSVYPVSPEQADEELAEDILRAGQDPNSVSVLKSVFFLGSPRPLNYLLTEMFGGPVLVLQGRKDPLNDAESRANTLKEICPNVDIKLLNAGHCPHDELPGEVNLGIIDFVNSLEESAIPSVVGSAS